MIKLNDNQPKKTPHIHAALIKAWADGAEIECSPDGKLWEYIENPAWSRTNKYRIKPVPKPDVAKYVNVFNNTAGLLHDSVEKAKESADTMNILGRLQILFDGETGKPKEVSLL